MRPIIVYTPSSVGAFSVRSTNWGASQGWGSSFDSSILSSLSLLCVAFQVGENYRAA